MLEPIPYTNYRLNSSILNCTNSSSSSGNNNAAPLLQTRKPKGKRVTFDNEAMAASEEHAFRPGRTHSRTPPASRTDSENDVPSIGSSCTWKQDQLDYFRVRVQRNVDVMEMIPERFFEFGQFERYEKCRRELLEISTEDLDNRRVMNRIDNGSKSAFMALYEIREQQSVFRAMNMAQKRLKKPPSASQSLDVESSQISTTGWSSMNVLIVESPPQLKVDKKQRGVSSISTMSQSTTLTSSSYATTATTATVKSTRRIVSDASIADPLQDSAGGARVYASNEKASDLFANILLSYVISSIWPDGIVLDWVRGRDGDTSLDWSSKDAGAILTMGDKKVTAKTDGSLQIQIPDKNSGGGSIPWTRQYYAIPLEAKRFSREGKEKEVREITDTKHSVFAGQILAEMLAGICHKEFYNQCDQEMFTIFVQHTSFQLYHAHFPARYLKNIHDAVPLSPPRFCSPDSVPADHPPHGALPGDPLPAEDGVTLRSTRLYDFCDVGQRREWLDILVALIEYLRSGESKVGYLNKYLPKNMLHKDVEDTVDIETAGDAALGLVDDGVLGENPLAGTGLVEGDAGAEAGSESVVGGLSRKRRVGGRDGELEEEEEGKRNTKVRRV